MDGGSPFVAEREQQNDRGLDDSQPHRRGGTEAVGNELRECGRVA
jgi:hypothetical protein